MDGVLFSSKSDLWETPQELFEKLNQEFRFEVDVCATQKTQNAANIIAQNKTV